MVSKPPRQLEIDGKTISSIEAFYNWAEDNLGLPDYFGRNLDALEECLIHDVAGPVRVVWKNSKSSRSMMGPKFQDLLRLLKEDLASNRADIQFVFE